MAALSKRAKRRARQQARALKERDLRPGVMILTREREEPPQKVRRSPPDWIEVAVREGQLDRDHLEAARWYECLWAAASGGYVSSTWSGLITASLDDDPVVVSPTLGDRATAADRLTVVRRIFIDRPPIRVEGGFVVTGQQILARVDDIVLNRAEAPMPAARLALDALADVWMST